MRRQIELDKRQRLTHRVTAPDARRRHGLQSNFSRELLATQLNQAGFVDVFIFERGERFWCGVPAVTDFLGRTSIHKVCRRQECLCDLGTWFPVKVDVYAKLTWSNFDATHESDAIAIFEIFECVGFCRPSRLARPFGVCYCRPYDNAES